MPTQCSEHAASPLGNLCCLPPLICGQLSGAAGFLACGLLGCSLGLGFDAQKHPMCGAPPHGCALCDKPPAASHACMAQCAICRPMSVSKTDQLASILCWSRGMSWSLATKNVDVYHGCCEHHARWPAIGSESMWLDATAHQAPQASKQHPRAAWPATQLPSIRSLVIHVPIIHERPAALQIGASMQCIAPEAKPSSWPPPFRIDTQEQHFSSLTNDHAAGLAKRDRAAETLVSFRTSLVNTGNAPNCGRSRRTYNCGLVAQVGLVMDSDGVCPSTSVVEDLYHVSHD